MPHIPRPAPSPLPLAARLTWLLRTRRWWAVTTLAALAAAALAGSVTASAARSADRWGARVRVPVAAVALSPGHPVTSGAIRFEDRPRLAVPDGVARDPVGARVRHPIAAGEVVLAARLAPDGLSEVAARLDPGTVGVAVPHDGRGLRLAPGDRVDVIATFPDHDAGRDPAFALAHAAVVVDVGEEGVTVAVPAADAPRLTYALAVGVVTLALVGDLSAGS